MKWLLLGVLVFAAPVVGQPPERAMAPPPKKPAPPKARLGEPEKQIREDVQAFFGTLNGENFRAEGSPFVFDSRAGFFGGQDWFRRWRVRMTDAQLELLNVKILKIAGDDASVEVSFRAVVKEGDVAEFSPAHSELLAMRHQHIPDPASPRHLADGFWGVVVRDAKVLDTENRWNSLEGFAYFIKQPPGVMEVLRREQKLDAEFTLSNLKLLGLGVAQFVQDYDEIYAFGPQYVEEALDQYTADKSLFEVPGTRQHYAFNTRLCGQEDVRDGIEMVNPDPPRDQVPFAQRAKRERRVVFYEGADEKPIFRYDGKAAICFADHHVQLVTPDEAKNLVWEP